MPQSNIYGAGAVGIADVFDDYLEAGASPQNCIALSLSARPLGHDARNAIEKSLEALGYGSAASTYATVLPQNESVEGGDVALDAQALFMLVEGLDPLVVIATDEAVAHMLAGAYRMPFEADSPQRVFGRPAVIFRDLEALLEADAGKQVAWRLFKTLPRK